MNERVVKFIEKCEKIILKYEKFIFFTRAKEYQQESVDVLEKLIKEAGNIKEEMIKIGDDDSANASLSIEENILSIKNKFLMLIALKNDDPNKAWDFLIDSQINARNSIIAHPIGNNLHNYLKTLLLIEKILFPPLRFLSVGCNVRRFKCSICKGNYVDCNHIAGKSYMGEICHKIIEGPVDITEVALVAEPASKRCRVTSFPNGEVNRDIMTWKVIPKENTEDKD